MKQVEERIIFPKIHKFFSVIIDDHYVLVPNDYVEITPLFSTRQKPNWCEIDDEKDDMTCFMRLYYDGRIYTIGFKMSPEAYERYKLVEAQCHSFMRMVKATVSVGCVVKIMDGRPTFVQLGKLDTKVKETPLRELTRLRKHIIGEYL